LFRITIISALLKQQKLGPTLLLSPLVTRCPHMYVAGKLRPEEWSRKSHLNYSTTIRKLYQRKRTASFSRVLARLNSINSISTLSVHQK